MLRKIVSTATFLIIAIIFIFGFSNWAFLRGLDQLKNTEVDQKQDGLMIAVSGMPKELVVIMDHRYTFCGFLPEWSENLKPNQRKKIPGDYSGWNKIRNILLNSGTYNDLDQFTVPLAEQHYYYVYGGQITPTDIESCLSCEGASLSRKQYGPPVTKRVCEKIIAELDVNPEAVVLWMTADFFGDVEISTKSSYVDSRDMFRTLCHPKEDEDRVVYLFSVPLFFNGYMMNNTDSTVATYSEKDPREKSYRPLYLVLCGKQQQTDWAAQRLYESLLDLQPKAIYTKHNISQNGEFSLNTELGYDWSNVLIYPSYDSRLGLDPDNSDYGWLPQTEKLSYSGTIKLPETSIWYSGGVLRKFIGKASYLFEPPLGLTDADQIELTAQENSEHCNVIDVSLSIRMQNLLLNPYPMQLNVEISPITELSVQWIDNDKVVLTPANDPSKEGREVDILLANGVDIKDFTESQWLNYKDRMLQESKQQPTQTLWLEHILNDDNFHAEQLSLNKWSATTDLFQLAPDMKRSEVYIFNALHGLQGGVSNVK